MIRVTFELVGGSETSIEAEAGNSLMEVAVANTVEGIEADCGGCMACGTCHVYIDEKWFSKLPPPSDMEQAVIDGVVEPCPQSRLSCQIELMAELDGMRVRLPPSQY